MKLVEYDLQFIPLLVLLFAHAPVVGRAETTDGNGDGEQDNSMVFYMHDVPVATNPSAIVVAAAGGDLTNRGQGLTYVFDDKLTVGADAGSNVMGAGQGIYTTTSSVTKDTSLLLVFTAVFELPERIAGSTLCFQGSDRISQSVREVAVTGGTGVFRFATGYATIETASSSANGNANLKFNVTYRTPTASASSVSSTPSIASSDTSSGKSSASCAGVLIGGAVTLAIGSLAFMVLGFV